MFPKEIDFKNFKLNPIIVRGKGCSSINIGYDGKPLLLQTPVLTSTFQLQGYCYPGTTTKKYSLNVDLNQKLDGVKEFTELLCKIDSCAKGSVEDFKEEDLTYLSPIKTPKSELYPEHLRCKMVSNLEKFKFNAYLGNKSISTSISNIESLIKRGTKMKLVLQLNPIWKVNKQFGVSYQIVGMEIQNDEIVFRR